MAEITRLLGAHHLRSGPTSWVCHVARGTERHVGVGQSFWSRPRAAVLSEVPVDDREPALVCHARTRPAGTGRIGQLTVSPDVVTALLARLGADR